MTVSFHADHGDEGRVIDALEEAGFDITPGNGPMVDWRITENTDSESESESDTDR